MSTLITIAILIIFVGFFVATEFAIVRVRSTQLETLLASDPRAISALKIHDNLHVHISSIQVAITLLTISVGAVGDVVFVGVFQNWFNHVLSTKTAVVLGACTGIVAITILQVVLAELLPRKIAIRSTVAIALTTARPLLIWSRLIAPITYVLLFFTNIMERLFGLSADATMNGEESVPSEEEIKQILIKQQKSSKAEFRRDDLIENVFDFSKRTTKEIAVPRAQVIFLDLRRPIEENLLLARSCPHTRLPVVDGDLDHIVGVIHLKELLWALHDQGHKIDLRALIKPTFSVPEMRLIHNLLLDFQQRKQHLAMVINEHGGVDGLVTLEDVLEELVGEIEDEFDKEVKNIKRVRDGIWVAHGTITLEQLEDELGIHIKAMTDSVTLGGLFQERLGRILKVGDELSIPGWHVKVINMRGMAPKKFLLKTTLANQATKKPNQTPKD